jgi:hypothetical protein
MFDIVEAAVGPDPTPDVASEEQPVTQSLMRNCGVYAGDSTSTDSQLFICEYHALTDLLTGIKTPCTCGVSTHLWIIDSLVQVHVCTATSIICIMDM